MSHAIKCDRCEKYGDSGNEYDRPYGWLRVERARVHFTHEKPEMDFCSSACISAYFSEHADRNAEMEKRRA